MPKKHVKDVKNPRSDRFSAVSFVIEYVEEKAQCVSLRMELPYGLNDYVAQLSWQEWESVVAWMHGEHARSLPAA